MKLIFHCSRCQIEKSELIKELTSPIPVSINDMIEEMNFMNIIDENVYHFRCNKEHDNILYLSNLKFEMLFESGIYAMLDDYFTESVLTLTAALERAYEFFIEIISRYNGVDSTAYTSLFKLVSNQSERQLGAFYFLYANMLKEVPPSLENKSVQFRNSVIHKGTIPAKAEVENYSRSIFELSKKIYISAIEHVGEEFFFEYQNIRYRNSIPKLQELHKKYSSYQAHATIPTMLCHMFVIELYKQRDYDSSLEAAKYWKEKSDNPFWHYVKQMNIT